MDCSECFYYEGHADDCVRGQAQRNDDLSDEIKAVQRENRLLKEWVETALRFLPREDSCHPYDRDTIRELRQEAKGWISCALV